LTIDHLLQQFVVQRVNYISQRLGKRRSTFLAEIERQVLDPTDRSGSGQQMPMNFGGLLPVHPLPAAVAAPL
jgi:hypothetical protein